MQKNVFISAALVALILSGGALFWAFQRGILYFEPGSAFPRFSKSAVTNPVPSLDRTPVYPANFPEEGKAIYQKNVTSLTETLSQDPINYSAWLDLAIYYRMIGDHAGAIEIWEYLRKLYPEDGVSRHNLGEYYFHEAKDYPKSENYYREAISVSPSLESNFTDLYEMYRYVYKQDTSAAVDILHEGIGKVAEASAIQFKIMLGRHYRDVLNDKENARKYLTEARDAAQARGDRSIANELTREINAL